MAATRDGAIARARTGFDDGSFIERLRALVGVPTESQPPLHKDFASSSPHPNGRQSARAEFGVAHGMPDVPVPEEFLDQAGVHALVGEEVAGGMTQHVRVGIDIEPSFQTSLTHDVGQSVGRQSATSLGDEHIRAVSILPQCP